MLHIAQIDNGVFDLRWDSPGSEPDMQAQTTLASAVFVALFTDAATDLTERVPQSKDRQGWWHKPEVGSSLWHVRRQPLSEAARREAVAEVQARLLRCDPALQNVVVNVVGESEAGSVSGLFVEVSAQHNGSQAIISIPLF